MASSRLLYERDISIHSSPDKITCNDEIKVDNKNVQHFNSAKSKPLKTDTKNHAMLEDIENIFKNVDNNKKKQIYDKIIDRKTITSNNNKKSNEPKKNYGTMNTKVKIDDDSKGYQIEKDLNKMMGNDEDGNFEEGPKGRKRSQSFTPNGIKSLSPMNSSNTKYIGRSFIDWANINPNLIGDSYKNTCMFQDTGEFQSTCDTNSNNLSKDTQTNDNKEFNDKNIEATNGHND